MVTFEVLGSLRAENEHGPLALKGPRHRALLARLLVALGRVVPVPTLIDDLWETPPRDPTGTLQTFVSDLRRILEPAREPRQPAKLLVTAAPGYALRITPEQLDANRFETLVSDAGHRLPTDPVAALANLGAALSLWQGPAYAEFADASWARAEITRLDELRSRATEQRARALTDLSRHTEAVAALEPHLDAHPLHEPAWHTLALALYRAGRQADALAAIRTIRSHLRDDLGVDPGPDLRQLESDILAQAPHLAVTRRIDSTIAEAGPSAARDTFIGRVDELTLLKAAAARVAASGRSEPVLISGIEGVGKTALVQALSSELAQGGWSVAWGPSPADPSAPPNWPWARITSALSAARGDLPVAEPVAESQGADPAVGRFHSQRAAVEFLGEVARGGPVLVVFDDLHWAEEETLELLTALATTPVAGPVLLVGTYRGTDVEAGLAGALARLARAEPVRIQLGGLGTDDAGELVRDLVGTEIGSDAVRRIHARGQGNPFYTRELARLWAEEGEAGLEAVPVGVRDVVRHRLERLAEAERVVLQQAAVIGGEVDFELLVELSGDAELADAAVAAALRAGFLDESGSTGVAFAHALVRDVVYRDIPAPRRSAWHARVGTLLEAAGTADSALLAYHFVRAATRATAPRAGKCSRAAALAAEKAFAPHEAARLWADAVAAYDRAGDTRSGLEATMGLVRALAITGRLPEAGTRRAEAIRTAERLGDPELTARVIVAFDVPSVWTDPDDPALVRAVVAAAEQALRDLPAADVELRCRLLTTIALELRAADPARARAALDEAETLAAQLDNSALRALTLNARFMQTFHRAGLAPERAAIGAELISLSQVDNLVTFEVLGHLIRIQALSATADFATADIHAKAVDALADKYGLPLVPFFTAWYAALRTSISASYDEAAAAYRSVSAAHPGSAMPGLNHGLFPLALLCLSLRHGKPIAAEPLTDWGPHEPWVAPLLLLARGDREVARTALLAAPAPPGDLLLELRLALLAHAALELAEPDTLRRVRDRLTPAIAELAGAGTGLVTLDSVARYLDRLDAVLE
ncbi:BTAD domain-containing putative transcriptional regulator [Nocardia concava]|uniref:BTAD domain-containing putative transcriptional regulator n=1 Tax=Nocardia concava TaxID=257281 RepID=UPI0002E67458|nr:BTAD domain-containing putative transcriptional regulator [Nocardia concava]